VAIFSIKNWPHWTSNTTAPLPMSGSGYKLLSDLKPRFWLTGYISLDKINH
jgi:hypothetical protein